MAGTARRVARRPRPDSSTPRMERRIRRRVRRLTRHRPGPQWSKDAEQQTSVHAGGGAWSRSKVPEPGPCGPDSSAARIHPRLDRRAIRQPPLRGLEPPMLEHAIVFPALSGLDGEAALDHVLRPGPAGGMARAFDRPETYRLADRVARACDRGRDGRSETRGGPRHGMTGPRHRATHRRLYMRVCRRPDSSIFACSPIESGCGSTASSRLPTRARAQYR